MSWLVTGGAGFIGAHVVHALLRAGHDVVVIDDLSGGVEARIPPNVRLVRSSLLDAAGLDEAFGDGDITGVVHVAAKKRVDESLREPSMYYRENVEALRVLLDRCVERGARNFVLSSSAAVYGAPETVPVSEDVVCAPTTPYGQTKLAGEWLTQAVGAVSGLRTLSLRYFNVAGAGAPELADRVAANLVPMVLEALGKGEPPRIFGDDYPTPDGTAIRDFIHVSDVADAHVVAARALESGQVEPGQVLNIGTGKGASVREVIDVALAVTGSDVKPVVEPRRPGDSAEVVAAVDRAEKLLGWTATRDVEDMVASAWRAMRSDA